MHALLRAIECCDGSSSGRQVQVLELDGVAIAGIYLEVDPPSRLVLRWDRPGSDSTALPSTTIEITLTPTTDGTIVRVQFSDLGWRKPLFSRDWATHLDWIASVPEEPANPLPAFGEEGHEAELRLADNSRRTALVS